jgi:hypothetical protein
MEDKLTESPVSDDLELDPELLDAEEMESPPDEDLSAIPLLNGTQVVEQLLDDTYDDLQQALRVANFGVSSLIFQIDNTVTFMLDNHQEVVLRVRKVEVESFDDEVQSLRVHCRTDFENVLILAKKLKMKISAFSTHFTVVLSSEPEFMRTWNDAILAMNRPALFFETLDELKRPIFLNLNHYIISRISD